MVVMRIGWGEYFRPELVEQYHGATVNWHARLQFLEAIEEIRPIRESTLIDVYPQFMMLLSDINELASGKNATFIPEGWFPKDAIQTINAWKSIISYLGEPVPKIRELTEKDKAEDLNPNSDACNKYIEKNKANSWGFWLSYIAIGVQSWAALINLQDAEWFYEMVIVLFWRKALEDKESWAIPKKHIIDAIQILPSSTIPEEKLSEAKRATDILNDKKQISFNTRHWHPIMETRETVELRMEKTFLKHIKRELDEMESLCESAGLKRTPEKRKQKHFQWLAYYIVEELDYEEIAQKYMDSDPRGDRVIEADSVKKAIKNTADLIGMKLRN